MNSRQKEVISASLDDEKAILDALEKNYANALADIKRNIRELQSNPLTQSKAYQLDFQCTIYKRNTLPLHIVHCPDEYLLSDRLHRGNVRYAGAGCSACIAHQPGSGFEGDSENFG